MNFREPIRIHTQGYGADLILTDVGGSCGDMKGRDCVGVHFENERGGFVLSLADLKQAVTAIEIELRWQKEEREREKAARSGGDPR